MTSTCTAQRRRNFTFVSSSFILAFTSSVVVAATYSNCQSSLGKTTTLWIGVQSLCCQSPAVHRGLLAAVRDVNSAGGLLPAGYELQLVNLTDPGIDEKECTVGRSNHAFLKYELKSGGPLCAVISGNSRATATCKDAVRYMADSTRWWDIAQVNVYPGLPAANHATNSNSFYSVAPSQWLIHRTLPHMLHLYDWKHVSVLTQSGTDYMTDSEDLLYQSQKLYPGLITKEEVQVFFSSGLDNFNEEIHGHHISLALLEDSTVFRLLCKTNMTSQEYVWILPDSFYDFVNGFNKKAKSTDDCFLSNIFRALDGSFSLQIRPHSKDSLPSSNLLTGKTRKQVYDNLGLEEMDEGLSAYSYDAVVAATVMFKRANGCCSGTADVSFSGLTGNISFDANLTGLVKIVYRRCSEQSLTCNSTVVAVFDGKGNVTELKTPDWPGGSKPLDGPKEILWKAPVRHFIGCCVALVIAMVVCAFLFIFTLKYKHARVIRLSGSILSLLCILSAFFILLGAVFNGLTGQFFSFRDKTTVVFCLLTRAVTTSGFVGVISTILMKTWRLRLIARQSAVRSKNERRRSSAILFVLQKETGAVVVVLVLICLDVCFLLCWNFLDPERIQRIPLQSSVHERAEVEFCTSSHPLQWRYIFAVYCSVLLLFALYMSWDARNLNIPFITNPKLLILSILSICGITIAYFILVFVFVAIDGGLMFVLAAVITLLMTGTVLVIEFVPKVYAVLFRKKEAATGLGNVRSRERQSMSEHCILQSHKVAIINRQNVYLKEVIQMMAEERNLSEATVNRIREEILDAPVIEILEEDNTDSCTTSSLTVRNLERRRKISFAAVGQTSESENGGTAERLSSNNAKLHSVSPMETDRSREGSASSWAESTV